MILEYGQDCGNRPDWVPKLLPSLRPGSPSPRGQVRGRLSPSLAEREMGQCSMPLVDTGEGLLGSVYCGVCSVQVPQPEV